MGGDSTRAYALVMGVGFLRQNGELQTWVERMGYLWFCAALRNKKKTTGGIWWVQTIVPPERAYVGDRPRRIAIQGFPSPFAQRRSATRRGMLSAVTTRLMPCTVFSAQHVGTHYSAIQMTRKYSVLTASPVHDMDTPVLPYYGRGGAGKPRAGVGALRFARETARVIAGRIMDARYLSSCSSRQSRAQIETSPLRRGHGLLSLRGRGERTDALW